MPSSFDTSFFSTLGSVSSVISESLSRSFFGKFDISDRGVPSAKAEKTESGWELNYAIPAAFLRRFFPEFRAESGAMICGNFYKCGDETVQPHYYSWNPVELVDPDFHRSEFFGKLYFE